MTATGVTFKAVSISWSPTYSETIGSALPALVSKDMSRAVRGTKTSTPIPPMGGGVPMFLPMGSEAPTVKFSGILKGESNFNIWKAIKQGDLLYVYASEYAELATDEIRYWWVDQPTFTRKGGYIDRWDYELTVIQSLRKGDQTVRT
jgi:hypothetical protein